MVTCLLNQRFLSETHLFRRIRIVLINCSANFAPFAVCRDYLLTSFYFKNSLKTLLTYSLPSSASIRLGLRIDFPIKLSVFVWAYLIFTGTVQLFLEKLSITIKIYRYPLLFAGLSQQKPEHLKTKCHLLIQRSFYWIQISFCRFTVYFIDKNFNFVLLGHLISEIF